FSAGSGRRLPVPRRVGMQVPQPGYRGAAATVHDGGRLPLPLAVHRADVDDAVALNPDRTAVPHSSRFDVSQVDVGKHDESRWFARHLSTIPPCHAQPCRPPPSFDAERPPTPTDAAPLL